MCRQCRLKWRDGLRRLFLLLIAATLSARSIDEVARQLDATHFSLVCIDGYDVAWEVNRGESVHGETITSSSTFHSDDLLELCTALTALKSVEMKVLSLGTDINRHLLYWKVPVAKKTRMRKVTLQHLLQPWRLRKN